MPTQPPTNNLTKWLWAAGGAPGPGLVSTTDMVIIPVVTNIVALERDQGNVVWNRELGETLSTPPGVGDGGVFVGSESGTLSALDLEDHLALELGLDSLDTLELLAEVEMRFNVHLPEDRLAEFCTMQRLLDAIRQSERCEHA